MLNTSLFKLKPTLADLWSETVFSLQMLHTVLSNQWLEALHILSCLLWINIQVFFVQICYFCVIESNIAVSIDCWDQIRKRITFLLNGDHLPIILNYFWIYIQIEMFKIVISRVGPFSRFEVLVHDKVGIIL